MSTKLPHLSQKYLLISLLACFVAAFAGSVFVSPAISQWYETIVKPPFNPPNIVFGPVWTLLYIMMAIALAYVLSLPKNTNEKRRAIQSFFVQLVLNALWTVLFFGFRRPDIAFVEILLLLGMIAYTMRKFYAVLPLAGMLFIPYFAWVSFAAILNFSIVLLNR